MTRDQNNFQILVGSAEENVWAKLEEKSLKNFHFIKFLYSRGVQYKNLQYLLKRWYLLWKFTLSIEKYGFISDSKI